MELFFQNIHNNYGHRIHKFDLTDDMGSPWNISQNKIAFQAACVEKQELKSTILILFTHQKRIFQKFSSKMPSATKLGPLFLILIHYTSYRISFEYSLIGIVKPTFTRRYKSWCTIVKMEDLSENMRKKQDRRSLNSA